MSKDSLVICEVCGFSVPTTDPEAVAEIAEHLRRKHPRYTEVDPPGSGGTLDDWKAGAKRSLHRFTTNRQSVDACVGVASRLRTALRLLDAVEEALRQGEANPGYDKGLLNAQDVRLRWQRILDGR